MPCHTVPWPEIDCSAYVPRYRSYYRPWLRESPDPFPAGISHFRPDTSDTVPDSLYPDDKMLRNNRSFHGFPYPSSPSQRTMPVPVSPKYKGSHLPSVGLTVLLSLTSAVSLRSYLYPYRPVILCQFRKLRFAGSYAQPVGHNLYSLIIVLFYIAVRKFFS